MKRSKRYGVIGGVCAGYGIFERVPISLVRIFALLLFLSSGGLMLFVYLFMWIRIPAAKEVAGDSEVPVADAKFFRSPRNRVIGGVCGALANYFETDPTVVRAIVLLLAVVGGIGLWTYLFAWAVIPEISDLPARSGPLSPASNDAL